MFKVLLVGPSPRYKGGIASVISDLLDNSEENSDFTLRNISLYGKKKIKSLIVGILFFFIKTHFAKVDLIHFNVSSDGSFYRKYIAYKISPKRIKYIVHIHSGKFINFYKNSNNHTKKMIEKMLRDANRVITINDEQRYEIINLLNLDEKKIIKIYNGIEIESNTARVEYIKSKNDTSNNMIISFMGKLSKEKGFEDFLKLAKLNEKNKNMTFFVAGDDSNNPINHIILNSEHPNVKYFGWVEKQKKIEFLKKTDVFVAPSYFEAFGLATVEAMYHYCIPVVYRVGGLKEIIGDEFDFSAQKGDFMKLNFFLNILNEYSTEDLAQLKSVFHQRALNFSNTEFRLKIFSLYNEILEGK